MNQARPKAENAGQSPANQHNFQNEERPQNRQHKQVQGDLAQRECDQGNQQSTPRDEPPSERQQQLQAGSVGSTGTCGNPSTCSTDFTEWQRACGERWEARRRRAGREPCNGRPAGMTQPQPKPGPSQVGAGYQHPNGRSRPASSQPRGPEPATAQGQPQRPHRREPPFCWYGAQCWRSICPFNHPKEQSASAKQSAPGATEARRWHHREEPAADRWQRTQASDIRRTGTGSNAASRSTTYSRWQRVGGKRWEPKPRRRAGREHGGRFGPALSQPREPEPATAQRQPQRQHRGEPPDCWYGARCTRSSCPFTHPKGQNATAKQAAPSANEAGKGPRDCRYGMLCLNKSIGCPFWHPNQTKQKASTRDMPAKKPTEGRFGSVPGRAGRAPPAQPPARGGHVERDSRSEDRSDNLNRDCNGFSGNPDPNRGSNTPGTRSTSRNAQYPIPYA